MFFHIFRTYLVKKHFSKACSFICTFLSDLMHYETFYRYICLYIAMSDCLSLSVTSTLVKYLRAMLKPTRAEPLVYSPSPTRIYQTRLEVSDSVANTPACYSKELITTVKRSVVQTPGACIIKHITVIIYCFCNKLECFSTKT